METVAIVGWTGAGRFEDLERTVFHKLRASRGGASRVGDSVLVSVDDPVAAARSLGSLPGVGWIAVGYRFNGNDSYLKTLRLLATRYLPEGGTFRISARSARAEESSGDLVLAGNSELLSSVKGAKIDERRPRVRFHVCLGADMGACGVEIRGGPGGTPTGLDWVNCLVSGGYHSSSMAWMAALSGFSIRLVHSRTGDAPLRQVARLYSELSFRMDARRLELVTIEGVDKPFARIGGWLRDHDGTTFCGLRPAPSVAMRRFAEGFPNLAFPLVLLQEESVASTYRSLGFGGGTRVSGRQQGEAMTLAALEAVGRYSERTFGEVEADLNAVIDALERPAGRRTG